MKFSAVFSERVFAIIGRIGQVMLAEFTSRRLQTSAAHQRSNHRQTLFHFPNCSGKSLHGISVLVTNRTASTNRRLSAAIRPGSPGLPGNRSLTRNHADHQPLIGRQLPPDHLFPRTVVGSVEGRQVEGRIAFHTINGSRFPT